MEEPPSKKTKIVENEDKTECYIPDLYSVKFTLSKIHNKSVNAVRISPDGRTFATCSSDGTIKVFGLDSGRLLSTLEGHSKGVSDIAFSPINLDILASCSDDLTIKLWMILSCTCIRTLRKHTYHVSSIKFNYKGTVLISGSADENVIIWDIVTGVPQKTLAAHSDPILSVALTPDSSIIVSGSYDGLMRLFDSETGQCLKTLTYNSSSQGTATASTNDVVNFPVSHVHVTPNGRYILSSGLDGMIRLWDYMNNKVVKTYKGLGADTPINERYSCDSGFILATESPLVAAGTDSSGILFWDVQLKKIVHQYKCSLNPVLALAVAEEGKLLVTCDMDGFLSVLTLKNDYIAT